MPARPLCRADAIAFLGLDEATFDALVARGDLPRRPDGRYDLIELQWLRDHWGRLPPDDGDDAP